LPIDSKVAVVAERVNEKVGLTVPVIVT